MKNLFFSAFIVLIGTGAAFATKEANTKSAIVKGYHFDTAQGLCVNSQEDCNTVETAAFCEWSEDGSTLRTFISPTMCGSPLYKIQ
ncbi:hypothetical protein [Pedobacter alluvionis]|uniref:Uncharacterized protein n=1 Tax=Pedobacter alluvionis TaxID=475253 RepID=A0A497XYC4_9SPHI|nr:hypothetical protein [Pedobacter alluvionis]RLJ75121.1 hypothetical protein BCL90_3469 [Pedobacter alluvionis]TFB30225.1 hypothetical protein E3V97_18830 [Pedobacter alluvionis]